MDIIVKIEDKKLYNSFVQFLKSLGLNIISAGREKKKSQKQMEFNALRLKTKDKSFSREQANER